MFRQIDSDISTGPCPYCKADAFVFRESDRDMFLCHQCYRYKPSSQVDFPKQITTGISIKYNNLLTMCTKVSELSSDHFCVKYCNSRKIPLDLVYYTDRFDELSKYAETPVKDKQRLILPLFDEDNELFGMQGRAFEKGAIRYITIMFDKDKKKLFGLERCDMSKTFVAVEGPIDSFFVNNCIAMVGSDGLDNKYTTNAVVCFDNEPRNKFIVSKMKKSLKEGFKTVIWPDKIKQKDINDMILEGIDVNRVIHSNVYEGLSGLIKLNTWKR